MVLTLLWSNMGRFILHIRPPNGHFPVENRLTYLFEGLIFGKEEKEI